MNSIGKIIKSFRHELKDIYPEPEIKSITELVFEFYLDFSKNDLILKTDKELTINEIDTINSILQRLKKHEPIQYILGETIFYDLRFIVKPGVLIPRPETEELVDWIVKENKQAGPLNILDIGTGSGCIAISLAAKIRKAKVWAYDVSNQALEIANTNAGLNNVKVFFQKQDILNFSEIQENQQFDIIVSNPPYVLQVEKKLMARNVLDFEPELALFVEDDDPLIFYKAIVDYSITSLKNKGKLYFEINESYGNSVILQMQNAGFENIELKKDINGKDRMICGQK